MKIYTYSVLLFSMALAVNSFAAGSSVIAVSDRSLYPYPVNTEEDFNLASRLEILSFVNVMHEKDALDEEGAKTFLGRQTVNMESIHKWQTKTHLLLVENFNAANSTCGKKKEYCQPISAYEDLTKFSGIISDSIPENLKVWNSTEQKFYEQYIYEQMRLAALFPATTSEIDTFSDTETTGSNLPDKQFLLSFDDGPTLPNGQTNMVIETLKSLKINGIFFILGDHVQADLKKEDSKTLADRYKGMCVASHGMEHQSHAKWDQWKNSMEQSSQLLKKTFGNTYIPWFRPPYGQRLPESQGLFFDKTILWNIDSQDWNNKIGAPQVGDRVLSLMLLWRRGIILFHDIHPKAAPELPLLVKNTQGSGIKWLDCHLSTLK